jgi:hypothetical protein
MSKHQRQSQHRRSLVSFSTVEVQEYPIIPDINPGVTKGIPMTIHWEPVHRYNCSVDDYERTHPRGVVEFRMDAHDRYDRLRRLGFSEELLMYCEEKAAEVRRQRRQTAGNSLPSPMQAAAERMKIAVWNVTRPKAEKEKERQFLMSAARANSHRTTTSRLASSVRRID